MVLNYRLIATRHTRYQLIGGDNDRVMTRLPRRGHVYNILLPLEIEKQSATTWTSQL